MARLLADENVPLALVTALRRLGYDVIRVQELGRPTLGADDPAVLRTASSLVRAVLTENAWDFIRLHQRDSSHQGIVTFTRDRDAEALARRVHDGVEAEGDLAGKLVRIRRPNPMTGNN